jgi:DNA polymerase I
MNFWDIRVIAGSYSTEAGRVVIDLYGRAATGESITARIRNFLPYFYIVEPPESVLEELKNDPEVLNLKEVDLEVEHEKRHCVKVTIIFPFKVPEYRNKYRNRHIVLAADIPFIHRFYYDFNLPACIRVHGEVVLDRSEAKSTDTTVKAPLNESIGDSGEEHKIIKENLRENPKGNSGENERVSIENKYSTDLIIDVKKIEPNKPFKPKLKILSFDIENSIKDSTIYCICCACRDINGEMIFKEFSGNEPDMLKDFAQFIRDFDPDVITGYNIDNFDIPVLMDRAERVNIGPIVVGRDSGKFYKVGSARFWRVHGRVIADAWWNAKMELRPKSETLNSLAKMLFNETKEDVDPSKIDQEWKNNPKKVIKYCTRDAELALRILEKIAVLDKGMDLAAVAKLPLDDAMNSGTSTLIDSILIREADKNAIGVPCTRRTSKTSKIEGGYVHTIKSGLYNYISVLDFRAMYPSIIIANNICFTTINSNGSIKSPTGVRFLNGEQRKGLLPKILEGFMADRNDAKQKMKAATDPDEIKYYDGLQAAIKILMNSVYGVFASAFYRFTDQKIGASITAFARKNIKDIISKLEQENISVIYSDTDSIFVETGSDNLDDAIKFGQSLAIRFTKSGRVLEFESIFEPFFSHGKKKRYVGQKIYPKEEMVVRGYETRRTDAFDLQKDVLTHMFELILSGKTDELVKYARDTINDVKKGNVPPEKLVISKTVKNESMYKDPDKMANVIAMRQLKKLGYEVVPGMKVSYLVTNGHKVPQEVEPFIENQKFEKQPDWEYYTERMALTISRIAEGIVPEHELDYQSLVTGSQQKSLFSGDFTNKATIVDENTTDENDSEPQLETETNGEVESKDNQSPYDNNLEDSKTRRSKKKKKKSAEKSEGATSIEDFL